MLRRLSVNALLKSVILVLAAAVIVVLALGAWSSWSRLGTINRIAAVAEASTHMFKALHNLRIDRSQTNRSLLADKQLTELPTMMRDVRAAEMPALRSALSVMETIEFPGKPAAVSGLSQAIDKLAALQQESAAALMQPKASRRPQLAPDYLNEATAMMDRLDHLSSQLTRLVKLDDAFIDQLLEIKQLAWVARNAGGDASLLISNGLSGLPIPPDVSQQYTANVARTDTAWAALEDLAAGASMPARFTQALETAKREFFTPEFSTQRANMLKAAISGERPMTVDQWAQFVVPKLAAVLGVAEAALDSAKDHAAQQRSIATWNLAMELAFLAAAAALALGMMLLVSRWVTGPLHAIKEAMLAVARGDHSVEVSFAGRKDEIGALGGALQAFRDSMMEADRLRAEQKEAEAGAAKRRRAEMHRLADEFQGAVGGIVDAVSTASTQLEAAAGTLTQTAESTQQLSGIVASASEDASANVQSVATASDEMSGSVAEIARQVNESSRIAAEAVKQAEETDTRITALSNAASRIGDVVKLITAIAEQTNLLALNATIEAARAGEAGRGFAVVAQEVKALAAQTAKATDEIGTQISSMQAATQESVGAIKQIGGTIGRVAEIAAVIAAAVEEQGAATQEISRNVQQAAQGTAQVATNITDVNRGASETGTASSQVLGSAQSLARESAHLRTEVEKFVAMVRAA
jgi:methyl-accepting chemotaxis protein